MLAELTKSQVRVQTQDPGQGFSAGEPTITLLPGVPSDSCLAIGSVEVGLSWTSFFDFIS